MQGIIDEWATRNHLIYKLKDESDLDLSREVKILKMMIETKLSNFGCGNKQCIKEVKEALLGKPESNEIKKENL